MVLQVEGGRELLAGLAEPIADGAGRLAQGLADLGAGQPSGGGHRQDHPLLLRELADGGVEPGQALAGLGLPVWPGHGGLPGRGLRAQGRLGGPAGGAGPVAVDGQVAGDREDPGALAVGRERRDLREPAPGPQEGLLDQVAGQLAWYSGQPRFFLGKERLGRSFFELVDRPLALALVGSFEIDPDVTPELLRDKVSEIVLVGKVTAPRALVGAVQFLTTEKVGKITVAEDDPEPR